MRSVDVLVPSVRLDAGPLLAILNLRIPLDVEVRWIIVADDPLARIPESVAQRIDGERCRVVRHAQNLGAAAARNSALEVSTGEWVLFLDDDVWPTPELLEVYSDAVKNSDAAIGFFGPTLFDPARTVFQRGVEVSDILTFFRVALWCRDLRWAPTANVLVRGDLARSERFLTCFPKAGGGEDIDYLLRITNAAGAPLIAVPSARVAHPWWRNGARDYTRFMRWSYGDSLLHDLHPTHVYRTVPNAAETLLLGLPIAAIVATSVGSPAPVVAMLVGVMAGEIVMEFGRLLALKGFPACLYCVETVLIRSANDVGRLAMQLGQLRRFRGVTERWDHFCDGLHIAYHRRWAAWKCVAHAAAIAAVALGL